MNGAARTRAMRESVVQLGPRQRLMAIATLPAAPAADGAELPLLLILNAGIIHRVGPNRLHVQVARAAAAAGAIAVRVDLSGIGDSDRRTDVVDPVRAALADIREAIDGLAAKFKTQRFVLAGLCSGADHAVIYAGSDPRVIGVVLLDPTVPRTRGYYARHYGRRLLSPATWSGILTGRHPMWRSMRKRLRGQWTEPPGARSGDGTTPAEGAEEEGLAAFWAKHPADTAEGVAFLTKSYHDALAGDRPMLALFTSGLQTRHNYRTQLLDALPDVRFGRQLQLEYLEHAEHTFDTTSSREQLVQRVITWLARRAGTAAPGYVEYARQSVVDGRTG